MSVFYIKYSNTIMVEKLNRTLNWATYKRNVIDWYWSKM